MGKAAQRKGRNAEREFSELLNSYGFHTQPGQPLNFGTCADVTGLPPETITRKFHKAIKESGVKRITVHSLRHSHASWLINNGVNILAVSKRLGHKDVSTTLRVYTHLLEQTDNDMLGKLNSYRK